MHVFMKQLRDKTNKPLVSQMDRWVSEWMEEGGRVKEGERVHTETNIFKQSHFNRISGTCDFDGGFCEWINLPLGDQFDWALNSGRTGTIFTGPDKDHTGHDGN